MDLHVSFYQSLFAKLTASGEYKRYELEKDLGKDILNYKQLHTVNNVDFLAIFVLKSQVPIKQAWTKSNLGLYRLEMLINNDTTEQHIDKITESRTVIEGLIGFELDWERRDGTKAGGPKRDRSIVALYYTGKDNNDERINWTIANAKPFIDNLTPYI